MSGAVSTSLASHQCDGNESRRNCTTAIDTVQTRIGTLTYGDIHVTIAEI